MDYFHHFLFEDIAPDIENNCVTCYTEKGVHYVIDCGRGTTTDSRVFCTCRQVHVAIAFSGRFRLTMIAGKT